MMLDVTGKVRASAPGVTGGSSRMKGVRVLPNRHSGFGVSGMPLPNRWDRGRGSGSGSRMCLYLTGGTGVGVRVQVRVLRWGLKQVSYSNLTRG